MLANVGLQSPGQSTWATWLAKLGIATAVRVFVLPPQSTRYLANRLSGLVIALNSSALPEGSRKNMVHCSPGWPAGEGMVCAVH